MENWNKKGYLQISFQWIFAIVVGIIILFLAIYLATKIINLGEIKVDATTAREIGILTNPLETGFDMGGTLTFPSGTRINNQCDGFGDFGTQIISVSQKSFGKYSDTNINVGFNNKYIFSDQYVEGKKFYLSSKPLEMPFKIADLIFLTSERYCFLDIPKELEDSVPIQENIITEKEECSKNDIKVCFAEDNCDINVKYGQGYVEKQGEKLYFTGNLLYGAIFSEKGIYECQVKRLMQRLEQLSNLYYDKSYFISNKCQSELNEDLLEMSNSAKEITDSRDLENINLLSEVIKEKNKGDCELF